MADVYKFKVSLVEFENTFWREIEITSVSSVAKLGYAVLAAFEAEASHLFNIRFNGKHYEIVFEKDYFDDEPVIDPTGIKLAALKLKVGDKLNLQYDYGANWKFEIELLSISEMKRGTGTHYPYITAGEGKGIIENIFPSELANIVKLTDEHDEAAIEVIDPYLGEKQPWDYRKFDLKFANAFFKDEVWTIKGVYERE